MPSFHSTINNRRAICATLGLVVAMAGLVATAEEPKTSFEDPVFKVGVTPMISESDFLTSPRSLWQTRNDDSSLDDSKSRFIPGPTMDGPGLGQLLWTLSGVLALAVAACGFVAWKNGPGRLGRASTGDELKLTATLPLPGRTVLSLVAAGRQTLVVATDAGGVKCVVQLQQPFADTLAESTDDYGVNNV